MLDKGLLFDELFYISILCLDEGRDTFHSRYDDVCFGVKRSDDTVRKIEIFYEDMTYRIWNMLWSRPRAPPPTTEPARAPPPVSEERDARVDRLHGCEIDVR